jgi:hypothetical protein
MGKQTTEIDHHRGNARERGPLCLAGRKDPLSAGKKTLYNISFWTLLIVSVCSVVIFCRFVNKVNIKLPVLIRRR